MLVDSEGGSGRRSWRGVRQGKAGIVLCLAALHEAARALSFLHGLPWRGVRGGVSVGARRFAPVKCADLWRGPITVLFPPTKLFVSVALVRVDSQEQ